MGNFLENMFGKIGPNMCKLSMNGDIAIKTSNGYKTYDVKKNKLVNCNNFVFTMGDMDCFFMIPTNKVAVGDIIIANGAPKCVIAVNPDKSIKCLNYETSVVEEILPERHIFMGNTYFYGKIVSLFGNVKGGKGGPNKIMKFMMMGQMMKGFGGAAANGANMLPMMMMVNGGNNLFEDMFDFDEDLEGLEEPEEEDGKENE